MMLMGQVGVEACQRPVRALELALVWLAAKPSLDQRWTLLELISPDVVIFRGI